MGRQPSTGGPVFRFLATEVAAMEKALEESKGATPSQERIQALADAFSAASERVGKMPVQYKQVWTWFINRRHALRKSNKAADSSTPAIVSSPIEIPMPRRAAAVPTATPSGARGADSAKMEFEAKSSRDTAWYDVDSFLGHRMLDSGELEVRIRFAGFGEEEDEWVNVRSGVRQRSLPCEATECISVLPGDLILCFQEGNEQALYYDARVKEVERRRHDARGCRCRFLVQYDHDGVVEIVPLRKVCRRPETEYRLIGKGPVSVTGGKLSTLPASDSNVPKENSLSLLATEGVDPTTETGSQQQGIKSVGT